MSRSKGVAVGLCAVTGLVASAASLHTHHRLLVDPGYTSFCDINAAVSCQAAYTSAYGSFMGRPVALFGVLWFGFVVLLAAIDALAPRACREGALQYIRLATVAAVPFVVYLAFAAFVILKVVCLLCLTTYAAVIGLLVSTTIGVPVRQLTALPRHLPSDVRAVLRRPAASAAVILFLSGTVFALAFFPGDAVPAMAVVEAREAPTPGVEDERAEFERTYRSLPRFTIPIPSDGATVLVVKFADFQCPPCRALFFGLRPVLAKYQRNFPGAVKLVSRDYPLEPECNQGAPVTIHPAACEAAAAVRLARGHGRGEALEEWFYGHQELMSPAGVRAAASTVGGVSSAEFEREYARVIDQVRADAGLGRLLTVGHTPTFFVNGVKLPSIAPEAVDLAIEIELRKAGLLKDR